jgi:drug/metabolite transporter (DMT)-like permease
MTTIDASLPDRDMRGVGFVFLAGVLWSTVGLGIRLIEDAQVWQILLYRSFSLSLLLWCVIRWRTGRSPLRQAIEAGMPAVIGALALLAAYTGGIYAIQTTSVAQAMLLFASAPFMAAILGRVILKESVRWQTWVAIAVAIAGILVMVGDKSGTTVWAGNLAALGSAFGFAVFTVTLRWNRAVETLPTVYLSGLFAIGIMGAICLMLQLPMTISPRDTSVAMAMGFFQVGAGLVFYTLGSKTVPAVELTLLSLAEVVLAPVWVWLALGELPTLNTFIGGAVLLIAITFNALSGKRRKPVALPK